MVPAMTDLIEIRAQRRGAARLHLTILSTYLEPSEVDRLALVLAGRDTLTKRSGLDLRLRGYGLGILIDAAAHARIGDSQQEAVHEFVRDFVQAQFADPEGDEDADDFNPDHFDVPDDSETPESVFVIERFIEACVLGPIHDPGTTHARAALAAQGPAWSSVDDGDRPHFSLDLTLADDGLAELFDGASWSTAYSL